MDSSNFCIVPPTKMNQPRNNHPIIHRPGLLEKLNQGLQSKVTLISAPAGYGKTTAVVEWLKTFSGKALWLSLDSDDNDYVKFWRSVTAVFQNIAPGVTTQINDLFRFSGPSLHFSLLPVLIEAVSSLETGLVLVMDDYHVIKNQNIDEGMQFLIRYLPPNLHLFLISRSSLPFSTAKLRNTGQLTEISLKDLKFNPAEIKCLYTTLGIPLDPEQLLKIHQQTEGWITGIQIQALEIKQGILPASLQPSDNAGTKNIHLFLLEEVFKSYDNSTREFLLHTSILKSFTASLGAALSDDFLTSQDQCAQESQCSKESQCSLIIQQLITANTFIFSLDDQEHWFRYHHLFSEFLYQKLRKTAGGAINSLHIKAAAWYERQGFPLEAVEQYLLGQEFDRAAHLIEKLAPQMFKDGEKEALMTWLNGLPAIYMEKHVILRLASAWYHMSVVDRERAWSDLEQAQRMITKVKNGTVHCDWPVESILGDLSACKCQYAFTQGNFPLFLQAATELARYDHSKRIFMNSGIDYNQRKPTLLIDDLRPFTFERMEELIGLYRQLKLNALNYALIWTGEMYYEWNALDRAIPLLLEGIDGAEKDQKFGAVIPGLITLAKIHRAQGQIEKALKVLLEGERRLSSTNKFYLLRNLRIYQVLFQLEQGKTVPTDQWIHSSYISIYDKILVELQFEMITMAKVLILLNRYEDALILLTRLKVFAEENGQIRNRIWTLNLLAVTYYQSGKSGPALDLLEEALAYGQKYHYLRLFLDEGGVWPRLFKDYLAKRGSFSKGEDVSKGGNASLRGDSNREPTTSTKTPTINYLEQILNCIEGESSASPVSGLSKLTKQEAAILELIKDGLSNEEISHRLNISLNTVKKHTSNLYSKIGAKSRTQAVKISSGKNNS
jgi:LuxR family maltose regulon positive regulatory protein